MPAATVNRYELADLIEQHATLLAISLRGEPARPFAAYLADDRPGAAAGAPAPVDADGPSPGAVAGAQAGEAVGRWTKIGELAEQVYSWPDGPEDYDPFEVWETVDARGRVQVGLGRATKRGTYYGKERGYWLAFEMVNGQKRRPIVVFNEADDFETSGDLVAIIKGKGAGGRSMFASGDELPAGYEHMAVEIFRDRVSGPQAFNRLAIVAEGGDRQAMCTHALLQLGLRS